MVQEGDIQITSLKQKMRGKTDSARISLRHLPYAIKIKKQVFKDRYWIRMTLIGLYVESSKDSSTIGKFRLAFTCKRIHEAKNVRVG